MSRPGGRGFGRADPKKSAGLSKSTTVFPSGRSGARGAVPKASTSQSKVGEARPSESEISEITARTAALSTGGNGKSQPPIGRGGVRGRRQISVVDIFKTKPETCSNKKGNFGNAIELVSNYFKIDSIPNWVIFQYRVDFSVEEDQIKVLKDWIREHRNSLKTSYIFDGTMLFTSRRLTQGNEPLILTSIRESDKAPVQITIRLIKELNSGNVVYLQVFNILVRRCLTHLNLHLVNRNYYDPKASIRLPQHNLEVWPGYVTTIRQHENNILMCAEIGHKIMRTDSALKLLAECANETQDYRRLFQQSIIGSIVLTDYNNKTYFIDDVDFGQNPMSKFLYKNKEYISFVQYYEQRYQIKITDMRQPLLISRIRDRDLMGGGDRQCLLVPELCRMTGLSSNMLNNRNLMRDLAEITRVPPRARIDRLQVFNKRLQEEEKIINDFKDWGLKINRDLIKVPGRELPPEQLIAGKSLTYSAGLEVDWTRSMRSTPMLEIGEFKNFAVICPSRIRANVEEFLLVLKKAADGMSFKIPKPVIIETRTDNPPDMLDAVERCLSQFRPDLIMFGFTSDRADRYSAVKKKCYIDRGIPSQVILMRSLRSKGVMSIATKVAVQINCKIGGAPWSVHIPTESIMVVGFDVSYEKGGKSKSVGASVASLNKSMTAWFSSVNFHSNGTELSDNLAEDIVKAVRKYRDFNSNKLPAKIVIYRDGVGEGQLNHVYSHEVVNIKKRLTELYGNDSWKLAYIIVTKRINTRFFNQGANPRPGTIVDDVVTLPEKYDFFLVSQSVRQGTVSPTNYNVISDNLSWAPNHIQRFTYKMTHLYYNCSTTVGVPAPCQYAHKLAFMVSQNLQAQPHSNLSTRLYYL